MDIIIYFVEKQPSSQPSTAMRACGILDSHHFFTMWIKIVAVDPTGDHGYG
jgi:hypothetical protein